MLSIISLLTDTASEMLYPVMPIYLKTIGFSVVLIGVLEGVAEATAGLSKGYFGKLSDASQRRVPFVRLGYALSAVSKPMMAVFIYPIWIFFARAIDRLGKGIRTGARDALLSDEATPATKGKVFGFHRSMDTVGAVIGPSLALAYLYFYPGQYKSFSICFPSRAVCCFCVYIVERKASYGYKIKTIHTILLLSQILERKPRGLPQTGSRITCFYPVQQFRCFLLLKIKQAGISDTMVIGVYIFYNLIYALSAFPAGILADKVGLKTIFIIGLALFVCVYAGFSINTNLYFFFILFFLYGIYAAATEGISKAWITNITDKRDTATAIGTYSALQSICTMLASSFTGFIWFRFGAGAAFMVTAVVVLLVVFYFFTIPPPDIENTDVA